MKLWKNNRTDQEWELSNEEIARRFWADRAAKGAGEVGHLGKALRCFIVDHEENGGLSSVLDESEYDALHEVVFATWPKAVSE